MQALRPPVFVVLPEGADRALRERHPVRAPHARAGDDAGGGRARGAVAAQAMPVLVDDGRTVVEATIIIEHLGLHHPGPVRLIPDDPRAALDVRMMDRFFDNYVMTPMQKIVGDSIRAAEERDPRGRRRGARAARHRLSLARRPHGGTRVGGGRRLQPRRLRGGARAVLRRLGAPDRRALRERPRLSATAARAAVVRARRRRGAAVSRPLFPLGAPDRD